jgi:hypothetical protein
MSVASLDPELEGANLFFGRRNGRIATATVNMVAEASRLCRPLACGSGYFVSSVPTSRLQGIVIDVSPGDRRWLGYAATG